MKCSIDQVMGEVSLLREEWDALLHKLPNGWEELASTCGALVRRRGVRDAQALLQLNLAYAMGDYSLRQVGLWGTLNGVAAISDVAILRRLRQSQPWLAALVATLLHQRASTMPLPAVNICVADATTITQPGCQGTSWRIHLRLNLAELQTHSLTLSDVRGGEGLQRFDFAPGEIVIADRAYGYARSLTSLLSQKALCVVRMRWSDLSRYQHQGQAFDVIAWLQHLATQAPEVSHAIELQLPAEEHCFALRLVACPLPKEQAERARQRTRRKAQKNQVHVTPASLLAAGYVLLVTNLSPAWSNAQIAQLYRLRWQIELYFKRLKGILQLDHLRARDPQLASVYLLSKMLMALLLDRLAHLFLAAVPSWHTDLVRPLSCWRLTLLLWSSLKRLFTLPLAHLLHLADPLPLRRYLCNAPRRRLQQDAFARLLVRSLSVVNVLYS